MENGVWVPTNIYDAFEAIKMPILSLCLPIPIPICGAAASFSPCASAKKKKKNHQKNQVNALPY